MTTITFKEDIKIKGNKSVMTVSDFFDILKENEIIPELRELSKNEVTPEILKAYNKSKKIPDSSFLNL